jgi:hypothetical protein
MIGPRRALGALASAMLLILGTAAIAAPPAGASESTPPATPLAAPGAVPLTGLAQISAGGSHTCAVTTAGAALCWGYGQDGELGYGGTFDQHLPVQVAGLESGVAQIDAGNGYSCAVTTAGGVKCWGDNHWGQLGDGTNTERHTPVDVVGLSSGVKQVSVGVRFSCALMDAGSVKCWGYNGDGQLGPSLPVAGSTTPVDITGLESGIAAITVGNGNGCALTTSAGVKCWGDYYFGGGNFAVADIAGMTSGITAVSTRATEGNLGPICAITTVGAVECRGLNLGNGGGNGTATAVVVPGLSTGVVQISTDGVYSCALTSAGAVKCWGDVDLLSGSSGPLTYATGATAVSAGGDHTCALTTSGGAVCWGQNQYGQLGDDTTTNRTTAVTVLASVTPVVLPDIGSVAEGDSGTTALQVPVSLSLPSTQPVTVQWNTEFVTGAPGNQADPATDYVPSSGTFTFAPGQTTGSVTIPVNGDVLIEPDEYVVVSFHDPTNATVGGFWGLGFGKILNDDKGPAITPGVGSVLEGNSGTTALQIPVTLSFAYPQAVTVQWTTYVNPGAPGNQADPATDYIPASGTLTFAPGETSKTVTVLVNGDTQVEPDEYLMVAFSHATNGYVAGFWGLGFGVITNDD